MVFPEQSESLIAREKWGAMTCTITSIECILTNAQIRPKVMVVVAPGFNIAEYIDIARFELLGRVPHPHRSERVPQQDSRGFYPALFYPGLAKVAKELLLSLTNILTLSPLAVLGGSIGMLDHEGLPVTMGGFA